MNQQDSLAHSSLKYEKQHGRIVWVMGPACAFDASSRKAFEKLVTNGYVHALLAGNALATHDLEAACSIQHLVKTSIHSSPSHQDTTIIWTH